MLIKVFKMNLKKVPQTPLLKTKIPIWKGLGIIPILMTHKIANIYYSKHIKQRRLEKGVFEFFKVRQQVSVDQNQYYGNVCLTKFFLKVSVNLEYNISDF